MQMLENGLNYMLQIEIKIYNFIIPKNEKLKINNSLIFIFHFKNI